MVSGWDFLNCSSKEIETAGTYYFFTLVDLMAAISKTYAFGRVDAGPSRNRCAAVAHRFTQGQAECANATKIPQQKPGATGDRVVL